MGLEDLTAEDVARETGFPIVQWPGKCATVCKRMLDAGLVEGVVVHGLWLGPIRASDDSPFSPGAPAQHNWIRCSGTGGIVDPTQWVFAGSAPFVYVGPEDDRYDFGGDRLRVELTDPSPPEFDASEKTVEAESISAEVADLLCEMGVGYGLDSRGKAVVTVKQLHWIATRPHWQYGDFAFDVFEWIVRTGWAALIPIDGRRHVLGEER